jgi:hypothetical protein
MSSRYPRLNLLLIVAFVSISSRARAADPFTSVEGGFRVGFPSAPELENDTIDSPQGKLPYHMYSAELPDGGFMVSYADYPDSGGLKPADRLKKTVDGQVAGQHGKVLYRKACALGKLPGIEVSFRYTNSQGTVFVNTQRNYLLGLRLFQTSVILVQESTMTAAQVKALLDSFQLTGHR